MGIWIPQKLLIRWSRQDLVFPFYHTVSDKPMPHVRHVYRVRSFKQFSKDLEFLLKHYRPVDPDTLISFQKGRSHGKPSMFLSFDDGLSEIYELVAPLLIKKGVPAGFFVNSAFIDNRDLFFRYKSSLLLDRLEKIDYSPSLLKKLQDLYDLAEPSKKCVREFLLGISCMNRFELDEIAKLFDLDFASFLSVKKPYMSLEQLKDLSNQGFQIGAHSKEHLLFEDLSLEDMVFQYRESMEFVVNNIDPDCGIFSFPFTDHGVPARFFEAIREKGMPRLDSSFGTAGLKKDPLSFHHQRIPMESGRASASRLIKGEYLYYLVKGMVGKNEIIRT